MRLIGIDYGKTKVGIAIATSPIAEPLEVIRYTSVDKLIYKINDVVLRNKIEKIVVGISEGATAKQTHRFVEKLKEKVFLPVVFQDETLTTVEATSKSIQANIKKKKRQMMEDSYSAALILQAYIDRPK
jgi:putative Holliday junction resolvase